MIRFPDIEQWMIGALSILNVKVVRTVPETKPAKFVWIASDGGPSDRITALNRIRVNCFAGTYEEAMDLARQVDAVICMSPDGIVVKAVRNTGPTQIPDPDSKIVRIYAYYELTVKGSDYSL